MKILVACECSGVVRDAFAALGHDAWSCDLKPTQSPGQHIQDDVRKHFEDGFDLMIAHPDCRYLTVACNGPMTHGCSLYTAKEGQRRRKLAINFFMACINAPIPCICVENPIGIMSTIYRKPDQIVQPNQFGDDASKATCLWLRNLPKLVPTQYVEPRMVNGRPRWSNQTDSGQNKLTPSPERSALRARTYPGIARQMAQQWSKHLTT